MSSVAEVTTVSRKLYSKAAVVDEIQLEMYKVLDKAGDV